MAPHSPAEMGHKKMATKGSCINFIFSPPYLVHRSTNGYATTSVLHVLFLKFGVGN